MPRTEPAISAEPIVILSRSAAPTAGASANETWTAPSALLTAALASATTSSAPACAAACTPAFASASASSSAAASASTFASASASAPVSPASESSAPASASPAAVAANSAHDSVPASLSDELVVVSKPGSWPVHATGRYERNTLLHILNLETKLGELHGNQYTAPVSVDVSLALTFVACCSDQSIRPFGARLPLHLPGFFVISDRHLCCPDIRRDTTCAHDPGALTLRRTAQTQATSENLHRVRLFLHFSVRKIWFAMLTRSCMVAGACRVTFLHKLLSINPLFV
jgi:hypothetical protein